MMILLLHFQTVLSEPRTKLVQINLTILEISIWILNKNASINRNRWTALSSSSILQLLRLYLQVFKWMQTFLVWLILNQIANFSQANSIQVTMWYLEITNKLLQITILKMILKESKLNKTSRKATIVKDSSAEFKMLLKILRNRCQALERKLICNQ